jgi:hypothetical protein
VNDDDDDDDDDCISVVAVAVAALIDRDRVLSGTAARTARKARQLSIFEFMSKKELDFEPSIATELSGLYAVAKHEELHERLQALYATQPKHVDTCWLLARCIFDLVERLPDSDASKVARLERGLQLLEEARAIDGGDQCCAVHKWKAILISEHSKTRGTTERIKQSFEIKAEALKASELDPSDPTPHFLLGVWSYEVANIGWITRKLAATIFAEPPTATFQEAIEHHLKCHAIDPKFKRNLAGLARAYKAAGDSAKSKEFAKLAIAVPSLTEKDREMDAEMGGF